MPSSDVTNLIMYGITPWESHLSQVCDKTIVNKIEYATVKNRLRINSFKDLGIYSYSLLKIGVLDNVTLGNFEFRELWLSVFNEEPISSGVLTRAESSVYITVEGNKAFFIGKGGEKVRKLVSILRPCGVGKIDIISF